MARAPDPYFEKSLQTPTLISTLTKVKMYDFPRIRVNSTRIRNPDIITVLYAGKNIHSFLNCEYFAMYSSDDVDPDWLYADPDSQNLMNADPDPGQLNQQINFNQSFKRERKSNLYLNFRDKQLFKVHPWKI